MNRRMIDVFTDLGISPDNSAHVVYTLATGEVREVSLDERGVNLVMTRREKQIRGECDHFCEWVHPYGWIPECGCEVHDRDE